MITGYDNSYDILSTRLCDKHIPSSMYFHYALDRQKNVNEVREVPNFLNVSQQIIGTTGYGL